MADFAVQRPGARKHDRTGLDHAGDHVAADDRISTGAGVRLGL